VTPSTSRHGKTNSRGFPSVSQLHGRRVRSFKIAGLVAAFLAAIIIANLTVTEYGAAAIIPNAFFLIGLDLITRDRLADFWGTTKWLKMTLLILAGGFINYWVNRHTATITEASVISFCAAEAVEATAYHILRHQRWTDRAPRAAIFGAAVDSIVFPTLAFGAFDLTTSFDQFIAKLAGALIWTWVISAVLPPPSMAPLEAA
jgi:uncharacterized PurR-regulated membrane protein YhhQ (DUF165 family)